MTAYPSVKIPGTSIQADLTKPSHPHGHWGYILWDVPPTLGTRAMLTSGALDLTGLNPTPEQVAHAAAILEDLI